MKYTRLLGKTLRDVPRAIRTPSYGLLHRAGFIRQMAPGLFTYLPLGMRVLEKIRRIIAEELAGELGSQVLHDDREESPGVKFMDADLLGIPLRIMVAAKHLAEGRVEIKERRSGRVSLVALDQVGRTIGEMTGSG